MENLKPESSVKKTTAPKYSSEVKECAVRMVLEHQREYESRWAAIGTIAAKIGCSSKTLHYWVRQFAHDQDVQAGKRAA